MKIIFSWENGKELDNYKMEIMEIMIVKVLIGSREKC